MVLFSYNAEFDLEAVRRMITSCVLEVHVCSSQTMPPSVVMYKNPGDVSFINSFSFVTLQELILETN